MLAMCYLAEKDFLLFAVGVELRLLFKSSLIIRKIIRGIYYALYYFGADHDNGLFERSTIALAFSFTNSGLLQKSY